MADVTTNIRTVNEFGDTTITPTCSYINVTQGTSVIKATPGRLIGAIVNSHTSGTVRIFDHNAVSTNIAATYPVTGTITLASGERDLDFRGLKAGTGIVAQVGGTANITFLFN